ncbi:MAG TPA: hypothetical protein VKE74_07215 [Gemmataceae bacterium]|nr:hypothetical protein [Gemmataceae bacterium]
MPTTRLIAVLAVTLALTGPASASELPCPCPAPVRGTADLVRMSRADLEALYRSADIGTIPAGSTRGVAIYKPGTRITVPASRAVHVLWKGKVFRDDGTMINRTFAGRAITAKMYLAESWLDGRPSLILDYFETSRLFWEARDEQREVAPGIYLGITYLRKCPEPELAMFYALDSRPLLHR